MVSRISLLFGAAFCFVSLSYAQIAPERSENCGSLLSSVISVCSQPTLTRPDWCCNELKKWNEARCWCEPNSFDALDSVAGTGAAYSFRDGFCGESFQRPARGNIVQQYATCEPFDSVGDFDGMEQCDGVSPSDLRMQRFSSLDTLRSNSIESVDDLGGWFSRMDELLTEDASLEVLGIFLARGRFEVKQYMMTRQAQYGFIPMTADFTGDHFWRNPRMVSYSGGATTARGYFNKREFVTFERCGARIESIYTSEDNYQSRYGQFWDAADARLMSRYSQTSAEWCADVSARCTGESYPFADEADCQAFHQSQASAGRVTCNRFEQPYVPQYALHGNTLACRTFYLDLAIVIPQDACSAVRDSNQNRCEDTQCPGDSFINPFARDSQVPQYESTPTHFCSDTECQEDWPSQAQIDSIPEDERAGLQIKSAPSAPPNESGPEEEIPPEVLATDDDSLMNTEFENQPIEQQQGDPVTSGSSFSPGSLSV